MTYNSASISSKLLDILTLLNPDTENSNTPTSLTKFISSRTVWSHVHMIQTLNMLKSNIDNEEKNELNTLKQAIQLLIGRSRKK